MRNGRSRHGVQHQKQKRNREQRQVGVRQTQERHERPALVLLPSSTPLRHRGVRHHAVLLVDPGFVAEMADSRLGSAQKGFGVHAVHRPRRRRRRRRPFVRARERIVAHAHLHRHRAEGDEPRAPEDGLVPRRVIEVGEVRDALRG